MPFSVKDSARDGSIAVLTKYLFDKLTNSVVARYSAS